MDSQPNIKIFKSSTKIICELIRLKVQQKCMECDTSNLNASCFKEDKQVSSDASNPPSILHECNSNFRILSIIQKLKTKLDLELYLFLQECNSEIKHIFLSLIEIKEHAEKKNYSTHRLDNFQQHILSINSELQKLKLKNAYLLSVLEK